MGAYEIYEKQHVENTKKYQLFKKSFIAFWCLWGVFWLSLALIEGKYLGDNWLLANSTMLVVCLMVINGLLYLHLLVFLISASGREATWWLLGVLFFNVFGVIFSYVKMKPIAAENGWMVVKESERASLQREDGQESLVRTDGQSENKKVNVRVGLERISAVVWCGLGGIFIFYAVADALLSAKERELEWAAFIIGLILVGLHFVTRWVIRGFLPKE